MRVQRLRRTGAFTLVEILIVVVILGILASIIIGLFSNTTADAASKALKDNLRNMRTQLELYAAQHGTYPSQASFASQMTQYTDSTGAVSASKTATHVYGPYILQLPALPVGTNRGQSGVTTMTYTAGFGWGYDEANGHFIANLPDTDVDPEGVRFNAY